MTQIKTLRQRQTKSKVWLMVKGFDECFRALCNNSLKDSAAEPS